LGEELVSSLCATGDACPGRGQGEIVLGHIHTVPEWVLWYFGNYGTKSRTAILCLVPIG
jgi:hypothetical protein